MRRFFEWIRIPILRHTMPPPGRIEAVTAAPKEWQAPRPWKIPPELEESAGVSIPVKRQPLWMRGLTRDPYLSEPAPNHTPSTSPIWHVDGDSKPVVTMSRDDWLGVTDRLNRLRMRNQMLHQQAKSVRRHAQKLQERLNRIAKLTPGRQRINELHRVATQFEHEAVRAPERWQADLLADVLFHRRMAWDLSELRDEVRGDKRMPGARTDPTMWRGPRP